MQPRDQRLQLFLITDLAFPVNAPILEHYAYRFDFGQNFKVQFESTTTPFELNSAKFGWKDERRGSA